MNVLEVDIPNRASTPCQKVRPLACLISMNFLEYVLELKNRTLLSRLIIFPVYTGASLQHRYFRFAKTNFFPPALSVISPTFPLTVLTSESPYFSLSDSNHLGLPLRTFQRNEEAKTELVSSKQYGFTLYQADEFPETATPLRSSRSQG